MTIEEAIAEVDRRAAGRTRYDGCPDFLDEVLVAEIKRLRAALSAQWRGMEGAPKDGTKIDLMFPGVRGRTVNCFWMDDPARGWVWLTPTWEKGELLPESKWMVNCYLNMQPIAWMYPPPPPAQEPNIAVSCRCGWQGQQSELINLNAEKCCPRCQVAFKSFPPPPAQE